MFQTIFSSTGRSALRAIANQVIKKTSPSSLAAKASLIPAITKARNFATAAPAASVNSYERLQEWLKHDLGHITDLEQLRVVVDPALEKFAQMGAEQDEKFHQQAHQPLKYIKQTIQNTALTDETKQSVVNAQLQALFLDVYFPPSAYERRLKEIANPTDSDEVAMRLKYPNPLPTLDTSLIFRNDERQLSQTERATTIITSMLKIFQKLKKDGKTEHHGVPLSWAEHGSYFGRTVVPTAEGNEILYVDDSTHITILVNGQPYKLPVLKEEGQLFPTDEIKATLDAIIADAHHHKTESLPLGSITAGPRKMCYDTIQQLDTTTQQTIDEISRSLFVVPLDLAEESSIKKIFTDFPNRWFGMTQIVVDPKSVAGMIAVYSKGDEGGSATSIVDAIVKGAEAVTMNFPLIVTDTIPFVRLPTHASHEQLKPLEEATRPYFNHNESLFDASMGSEFFKEMGLNPNASVQFLLMLAARKIAADQQLPAYGQAIGVQSDGEAGAGLDWLIASTRYLRPFLESAENPQYSDIERMHRFKTEANRYAKIVKETTKHWSPVFFLEQPTGELYDALSRMFVEVGNTCGEKGYAAYLFRPTRLPGTMDVLVSYTSLPPTIALMGRPGGTLEAVSQFGAHIAYTDKNLNISYMPNVQSGIDLTDLHNHFEEGAIYIKSISNPAERLIGTPEKWTKEIELLLDRAKKTAPRMLGYPVSNNLFEHKTASLEGLLKYHWQQGPDPFIKLPYLSYGASAREIEKRVVEFTATQFKGEECWGYVASGGHESNRCALLMAREKYPRGVLYFSKHAHYGVGNLARELGMDYREIPCDECGNMDMSLFQQIVDPARPAIVVATIGTTMTGAIDDVREITDILQKQKCHEVYIHCDGALTGNYAPFHPDLKHINFKELPIDSIAISPYKGWGSTVPNSVFLSNEAIAAHKAAEYVMITEKARHMPVSSRSSLSAILAMDAFVRVGGPKGMQQEVNRRFALTQQFVTELNKQGWDAFAHPTSTIILFDKPSDAICEKWQLATEADKAHIVVSGHVTTEIMTEFLRELGNSKKLEPSMQFSC